LARTNVDARVIGARAVSGGESPVPVSEPSRPATLGADDILEVARVPSPAGKGGALSESTLAGNGDDERKIARSIFTIGEEDVHMHGAARGDRGAVQDDLVDGAQGGVRPRHKNQEEEETKGYAPDEVF
jgi:hypothetical protein